MRKLRSAKNAFHGAVCAVAVCGFSLIASVAPAQQGTRTATAEKPLSGKVALITGSARNLGRGYAIGLATDGADIVVHYHEQEDRGDAEETARQVRAAGTRAVLVGGNLCEMATIKRLFDQTMSSFGRIDIVVNNAGKIVKKPIADITEAEFDSVFCVNAKAPFFVMQEAARRIADNGRIINIGTTQLASVLPNYAIYAGSKASLEHFTRALAREMGQRGVTVNVVAPGPIDTPFYRTPESPEAVAYATNLSVARRLGAVADIVPLVRFLASPEAQWISAQTIFINGGYAGR
jgi:NAD(P)-dependent dehydrogenase (short-subunit alcohol dehydrogenase family)